MQIMGRGDGGHCRATVNACRVGGGPAVAGSPRYKPAGIPCNAYIAAVMGGSLLRRPSLVKNIQKRSWESRCSIFSGGCQKPRSSMLRGGVGFRTPSRPSQILGLSIRVALIMQAPKNVSVYL